MKKYLLILGLFVLGSIGGQLGLEAARAAFWQWSQTSINNQTADPSINWSEGMSPSSVNDSARAMMARLVEQAKDTSGQLTTTGGPTAYAVTTNQGFPNPPQDGQVIGLSFNVTNGANPTLAVDGGAVEPILVAPSTGVPANLLTVGVPFTMKFNAATSSWLLRDIVAGGLDLVPLGTLLPYTGTTVPNGNYVFANGQCISQTTYALYYAFMGSPGTTGCAAGLFHVIDVQGRVPAGIDQMGGAAATNRLTSSVQGCGTATTAIGAFCNVTESHTMTVAELVQHSHGAPISDPQHYHGLTFTDPGHFHATTTSDGGHYHSVGVYDPTHLHTGTQEGVGQVMVQGGGTYYGIQGNGGNGSSPSAYTNIGITGALGTNSGVSYSASTGVTMTSGNGNNTTGSKGTGITMTSANGALTTGSAATGIHVSGVSVDNTSNTGSTTPFTNVQPTIVVSYIIRVL